MSEQDSKRATLSVKKRTVATPSTRDEKPRLRAGARGRQVAQLKLAKDKTKRSAPPTREAVVPKPCRKFARDKRLKKKYLYRKSI